MSGTNCSRHAALEIGHGPPDPGAGNNDGVFLTREDIFDCYDLPWIKVAFKFEWKCSFIRSRIVWSLCSGIPIDGLLCVINFWTRAAFTEISSDAFNVGNWWAPIGINFRKTLRRFMKSSRRVLMWEIGELRSALIFGRLWNYYSAITETTSSTHCHRTSTPEHLATWMYYSASLDFPTPPSGCRVTDWSRYHYEISTLAHAAQTWI
jgi:hypothetical protein